MFCGKAACAVLIDMLYNCTKCCCRDPAVAEESAAKIYGLYEDYKKQKDFVGMDMSRKFLQMGYTRAMRYANHKGGRKYDKITHELLPKSVDPVKIESAQVTF